MKSPGVRVLVQSLRNARAVWAVNTPVGTSALQRLVDDLRQFGVDYALWASLGQFNSAADRNQVEATIERPAPKVSLISLSMLSGDEGPKQVPN